MASDPTHLMALKLLYQLQKLREMCDLCVMTNLVTRAEIIYYYTVLNDEISSYNRHTSKIYRSIFKFF